VTRHPCQHRIDALVHEFYELTPDEIRILEVGNT
jgi:hypothetical protein